MFRWLAGKGASRRKLARTLAQVAPEQWNHAIAAHAFLGCLSPREDQALRERAAWILASKSFHGAHDFPIDDDIMLSIAMQAALPILELSPVLYEGWTDIVLYPGGFLIPRVEIDEDGIVHEYLQESSGEAWDGGPVILSWEDADPRLDPDGNVVIHEFAHKLDQQSGDADGMPGLHAHADLHPRRWRRVLDESFETFGRALTKVENAIPRHIDPESAEASPWYDTLPLDPYAATDPAEFFAVSSEAFFVDPAPVARALPDWYALLARYYRQNPLQRLYAGSVPGTDELDRAPR
ncbi:MAG TPA: M90 family metallopeptidase [Castellaniella sp.]|nr:M90 family metallopeptidase [Castellaniella sp.]